MLEVGGASMREFHCKDVGMPDCSFVAKGKDDDEVMRKAAEHAKKDHNMQTVPPDLERRARSAIRESSEANRR
jgi:predicted small metal-binding protein